MSLNFGPSDIIAAARAIKYVCDTWFPRENRADAQLEQFGREVCHLRDQLGLLAAAYNHAAEEYGRRAISIHENGMDPKHPFLEKERKSLIGDFGKTIQDCTEFLEKHAHLVNGDSLSFLRNSMWHASGQSQLESLRARMHQHIATMQFVIGPLQLGLLRDISETVHRIDKKLDLVKETLDDIDAVLRDVHSCRPSQPESDAIPVQLEIKFQEALQKRPPLGYPSAQGLPLDAGFRALYHNFLQSTRRSQHPETSTQPIAETINLMKCRWLLRLLQQSESYKRAYYYKGAILEIEQLIAKELGRPDLTMHMERDLIEQPASTYLIWAPEPVVAGGSETLDERILELTLPGGPPELERPDLVLYRVKAHMVRLDRHKLLPGSTTPSWFSETVNIESHHFIPRYTVSRATPFSVELTGLGAGSGVLDLADIGDVYRLQSALTGYNVLADMEDVDISVEKRSRLRLSSAVSGGSGRVQIWQWATLPEFFPTETESPPLESRFSEYSEGNVTRITARINPSILNTTQAQDGTTSLYAYKPPLPSVVMFVGSGNGYSIFQLELGLHLEIAKHRCNCRRDQDSCRRLVIEARDSKSFTVRQLSKRSEHIQDWNLLVFARHQGLKVANPPRHPDFNNTRIIQQLESTQLVVDFATVDERKYFTSRLRKAISDRNQAEQEYRRAISEAQHQSGRPNRTVTVQYNSLPTRSNTFASSVASSKRTAASSPTIPLVPSYPSLRDGDFRRSY